jgi:tetratricopeptide (TPR) repeat protein
MYAQAEALYLSGRNEEAIAGFQEVIDRFPNSNDAARSQFAIGFIYENYVGLNDSAEVHYRTLVKSFPRTAYATTIQPRLLEIDQVRKEMEAARRRDSVAAVKTRDSLAAALKAQDSLAALKGAPADTMKAAIDTLKAPPPTTVPTQETPPDTTAPPPGELPPSEPPPPEPPQGEPPQDQPPSEPPPDEEPVPAPPDIIRPGYR